MKATHYAPYGVDYVIDTEPWDDDYKGFEELEEAKAFAIQVLKTGTVLDDSLLILKGSHVHLSGIRHSSGEVELIDADEMELRMHQSIEAYKATHTDKP